MDIEMHSALHRTQASLTYRRGLALTDSASARFAKSWNKGKNAIYFEK